MWSSTWPSCDVFGLDSKLMNVRDNSFHTASGALWSPAGYAQLYHRLGNSSIRWLLRNLSILLIPRLLPLDCFTALLRWNSSMHPSWLFQLTYLCTISALCVTPVFVVWYLCCHDREQTRYLMLVRMVSISEFAKEWYLILRHTPSVLTATASQNADVNSIHTLVIRKWWNHRAFGSKE